ncbi:MAG: SPOR domain-containing protein, partial [Candidatus Aminicenantes bacterium]|nr:SPOR domain-containing protein [Candidatus Aminicenantes bacterium]
KQVELAAVQQAAPEKVRVEQPVRPPAEEQKPAEKASGGMTAAPGGTESKAAVKSPTQTETSPSQPPKTEAPPPSQEKPPAVTTQKTEAKAAKAEPSKKPAPKPSGAVEAGLWYVQVGALDSKAGAQTHSAPFRKQGYNVIIHDPRSTDRRPVYRVWIGGYATKAQAQDVILKLNAAAKKRTGYYPIKG